MRVARDWPGSLPRGRSTWRWALGGHLLGEDHQRSLSPLPARNERNATGQAHKIISVSVTPTPQPEH